MKDDGDAPPLAAEAEAVQQVTRSVQERHPHVSPEHIAERARAEHQRYETAPIRDFVPLLIERALLLECHAREREQ